MALKSGSPTEKSSVAHLVSGGIAGFAESICCHPLDTVKVRMQLAKKAELASRNGAFATFINIIRQEGPLSLYKGYNVVLTTIVPKMAIRFSSYEYFKTWFSKDQLTQKHSSSAIFIAGMGAGITESILIVNPMDIIKIRLQAQKNAFKDPSFKPKYSGALNAFKTIVKEEGFSALYNGVSLTTARQATNQAVNFTVFQKSKDFLSRHQNKKELPAWQNFILGGISGGIAPIANSPIDTIKTRIQKQVSIPGQSGFSAIRTCVADIIAKEGYRAFYNGLTPRLLRVAPGQAITFCVYEKVSPFINVLTQSKQ